MKMNVKVEKAKRKRLYIVKQAVWGADSPVILYFGSKKAMDNYLCNHDYCNYDGYIVPEYAIRRQLLFNTDCYLANN